MSDVTENEKINSETLAKVAGEAVTEWPKDLFIPPDALEVFLETFEGPLDLLLYLIRKQNLDILDIPVAEVTAQYMGYIELMQELHLDLAAEYLVMAAMLAEIKSRMLLPRPTIEEEEHDPRAELVRRLQQYERYSRAAQDVDDLPRVGREVHLTLASYNGAPIKEKAPEVKFDDMMMAFLKVMERAALNEHHRIGRELLSVRERMTRILSKVKSEEFINFEDLLVAKEGRMGVIVSFLAILELLKESLLIVVQPEPFAPIHIKAAA